jgi:hypothetical protein
MTGHEQQRSVFVSPFGLRCAADGCSSEFAFTGGTVVDFIGVFAAAHREGWLCLMRTVLDVTCPECNRRPRAIQKHQVMRRLAAQPEWKRNIVVLAWASMAEIRDDDYLRETDMPMWLGALLGDEVGADAAHVRNALEHMHSTLWFPRGRARCSGILCTVRLANIRRDTTTRGPRRRCRHYALPSHSISPEQAIRRRGLTSLKLLRPGFVRGFSRVSARPTFLAFATISP